MRTTSDQLPTSQPQFVAVRDHNVIRVLITLGVLFAMVVAGLGLLTVIGLESGVSNTLLGAGMAVALVPLYLALALWIDRFEPEPRRLLALAFAWGATIACGIAFVVNTGGFLLASVIASKSIGNFYAATISAPFIEESAKGSILIGLLIWRRHEIDGVVDGVVYAIFVGLGFAMTENVLYYSGAANDYGATGAVGTFVVRGLFSPFTHPLFTSATGVGIAIAAQSKRKETRILAPLGGLFLAMILHSMWNFSASGGGLFILVYFFIMLPLFTGAVIFIFVQRHREQKALQQYLGFYCQQGMLHPYEIHTLTSQGARKQARIAAKRSAGRRARRKLSSYQTTATALAFHRKRLANGSLKASDPATAKHEQQLLGNLRQLRQELHALGVR